DTWLVGHLSGGGARERRGGGHGNLHGTGDEPAVIREAAEVGERDELAVARDEPSDRQRCRMTSRGSRRNTESSALIVSRNLSPHPPRHSGSGSVLGARVSPHVAIRAAALSTAWIGSAGAGSPSRYGPSSCMRLPASLARPRAATRRACCSP